MDNQEWNIILQEKKYQNFKMTIKLFGKEP